MHDADGQTREHIRPYKVHALPKRLVGHLPGKHIDHNDQQFGIKVESYVNWHHV